MMFITDKRDDGTTFYKLTDEAPEWLKEAVREAHNGTLPNDWIYAECSAAYDACAEGSLTSDEPHDHADSHVEVYTQKLYQWAADFCLTDTFSEAEEEANDLGSDSTDMVKRLSVIQYFAIARIARIIAEAYEANAE